MSDPLNSIPALIPTSTVPSSSSSKPANPVPLPLRTQTQTTTKTRAELDREAEEAFDKFSTLFSPATPRASPVLDPLSLPALAPTQQIPIQPRPNPIQTHSRSQSQGFGGLSPDSEFGSFVSVPAAQDPLSLSLMTPGADLDHGLDTPLQPTATRPGGGGGGGHQRMASTGRGLLDELLMYEEDPLGWIKDVSSTASTSTSTSTAASASTATSAAPPPDDDDDDDLLPSEKPNKYMTDSLSDLDLEFFSSGQLKTDVPHRRSSSASSHLRSPTRTPSAPVLAPPVASTGTSADAPGFDLLSSSSSSSTSSSTPARALPARSNSYASLASLTLSKSSGAKWVASFLPTALSAPSASIPNTNLLPESPSALAGPDGDWPHHGQTIPPYNNNTHNRNHSAATPHPTRAPVPVPVPDLTHFTPFGAKPPDTYAPPSGAPGFRGATAYDWDKGYSRALERDLGVGAHERTRVPYADFEEEVISDPRRPSPANGNGRGNGQGPGGGGVGGVGNGNGGGKKEGVGVLLDKKMSGVISLTGRREGTVGVLTQELVALIHAHLPALLRLPRQWTLFYSLDQHGISLNTLYARCAPPSSSRPPHPKGALVAMQDAAGMLFGAWVADGLRKSTRGGYYGGGESFLWRYLPSSGKFDVYKWTGKNDYVALCEEGFISFGGGDGHYGLYLDESLFDGSSARCPTFDNEPLCSGAAGKNGNINFECVGLEVWGVGP